MNSLQQSFKFPKKLWLVISSATLSYLFLSVRIGYPGKFPSNFTACEALVEGEIPICLLFTFFWLVFGFAFGAFVASILGVVRQLFWKSK